MSTDETPSPATVADRSPLPLPEPGLGLREAIALVQAELASAIADRAQGHARRGPNLSVERVEIELTGTFQRDSSARGGLRFFAFSGEVGTGTHEARAHRVKVVLTSPVAGALVLSEEP